MFVLLAIRRRAMALPTTPGVVQPSAPAEAVTFTGNGGFEDVDHRATHGAPLPSASDWMERTR